MKVTIAIPSYRRPMALRRALNAVARQEHAADEVIVVARSEDVETHSVVREFVSVLPLQLQLVDHAGVVAAYNRALDSATGDILSFIDDDAAPHADWMRRIVDVFTEEADLAGLGGRDCLFLNGQPVEGKSAVVGKVFWYGRTIGGHHLGVGPRRNVDSLKGVNMSFRTAMLRNLRMDSRLRGSGAQWHCELKFCLELRVRGERLAYDPAIMVDHFPDSRYDEDQRGSFSQVAYENQVHNLTLVLLEYLRPGGRALLLAYALTVGIKNNYCGLLKGLLYCPRIGISGAWRKTSASARGVWAAWKTWKQASAASSKPAEL